MVSKANSSGSSKADRELIKINPPSKPVAADSYHFLVKPNPKHMTSVLLPLVFRALDFTLGSLVPDRLVDELLADWFVLEPASECDSAPFAPYRKSFNSVRGDFSHS